MAEMRMEGVRVYIGPPGADPLDPDSAEWTSVGFLDPGSIRMGVDLAGEPDEVVWSATVYPEDGWTWAQWWDRGTGAGGALIEVEPTSVVDTPIDDAPEPSSPDR